MESRSQALAAGFFAITLLAAAIAMFLWLTRDTTIKTRYVLVAQGNVTGLKSQAPVRYKGLDVGSVESLEFDQSRPGDIRIYIRVQDETPITTATFAELGLLGVTGLSFVQLLEPPARPGAARAEARDPSVPIPLRASLVERVSEVGESFVAQSDEVTRRINAMLHDKRQQELFAAVGALRTAAERVGLLAQGLEPAAAALPAIAADTRKVLASADGLMQSATAMTEDVRAKLASIDAAALSLKLNADKVGSTADDLSLAARALARETTPSLARLIAEASRGSRGATRLIERIADEPQSLLFGASAARPGPGEPGFRTAQQ
jgi:phospholipid/cholesterol/gamma-HCH transport system substrate-binding protein